MTNKPVDLNKIVVVSQPLVLTVDSDVDAAESKLGSRFPSGYRDYITRFGEGILGGTYIRIYPPRRILTGLNNIQEWRQRIAEYWLWEDGAEVLSQDRALECIIIGDTLDGDELVFHPDDPDRIYVVPRNSNDIFTAGPGLLEAMGWLCSSGILTEPFTDRNFEPFDSRNES